MSTPSMFPNDCDGEELQLSCTTHLEDEDDWDGDDRTTMERLEDFLDEYSSLPMDDRSSVGLEFKGIVITRRMITLLRPLLCLSLHDNLDSMETLSTGSSTANNTSTVFSSFFLSDCCRFYSQDDATLDHDDGTPEHEEDICTPDDKRCFLFAISRCSRRLTISKCPKILSDLLNIPEIDHLEAKSVTIEETMTHPESEYMPLTKSKYVRLGSVIQRCVELTDLSIILPFPYVPQEFCDSLANAIQVQSLDLRTTLMDTITDTPDAFGKNEDGDNALEGLLRNPQNQLKVLKLHTSYFEDHHGNVLAQLLPTSQIQEITLHFDNIEAPGLLEFARQLPRMQSLISIDLLGPWEESSFQDREELGSALLHGLMGNTSLQGAFAFQYFPQYLLLGHYLYLNRAGRKLLPSSQELSSPDGLWPHILSRAGRNPDFYENVISFVAIDDNITTMSIFTYPIATNAVYFFLQNFPRLLSNR